jgi:hypothetical protein
MRSKSDFFLESPFGRCVFAILRDWTPLPRLTSSLLPDPRLYSGR